MKKVLGLFIVFGLLLGPVAVNAQNADGTADDSTIIDSGTVKKRVGPSTILPARKSPLPDRDTTGASAPADFEACLNAGGEALSSTELTRLVCFWVSEDGFRYIYTQGKDGFERDKIDRPLTDFRKDSDQPTDRDRVKRAVELRSDENVGRESNLREKAESRIDTARDREERREERKEEIEERTKERIEAFFERVVRRMGAAFDRMEGLIERIESRITKLEENGLDVDASLEHVDEAKRKLEEARNSFAEAVRAVKEDLFNSDSPRDIFGSSIKEAVRKSVEALKDVKDSLREAVRVLKASQSNDSSDSN